jgi:hypothetical protein
MTNADGACVVKARTEREDLLPKRRVGALVHEPDHEVQRCHAADHRQVQCSAVPLPWTTVRI